MRLPLELEHLIKESAIRDQALQSNGQNPQATLAAHLQAIEARKALEVEHYLQACILRLEIPSLHHTRADGRV